MSLTVEIVFNLLKVKSLMVMMLMVLMMLYSLSNINHLVLMICLTVTNLQVVLLGSIHSISETSKTFIFQKLQEVAEDYPKPEQD